MTRDEAIKAIAAGLKKRRGPNDPQYSVTGGRGTAYGWITVDVAPRYRTWRWRLPEGSPDRPENYVPYDSGQAHGEASPDQRRRLAELLGLESVHCQGVSIPASDDYRREYVARALGHEPPVIAKPYWD